MKQAARAISHMAILKFFPSDDVARAEIVSIACRMARSIDQIEWLSRRCVELWNEWEGPREMRAVFCSKYRPQDGIDIVSALPQFADGIPSEDDTRNQQLIGGAGEVKRLPAGPVAKILQESQKRTIEPGPRERDKLDEIDENYQRGKAPLPDESEIDRIKREQEEKRRGDAAVEELKRKLGIEGENV